MNTVNRRVSRSGIRILLLCVFIVVALCPVARAQQPYSAASRPAGETRLPGLEAATGLLRTPSAYVQRDGEITAFAAGDRHTTGGVLLGLGQRLEMGLAAGSPDTGSASVLGSAKLNLVPETLLLPTLSVGVLDAFDSTRAGPSGYIVVSKYLIPYFVEALSGERHLSLKLHAGFGGGLYRNRPFGGIEVWGGNGIGTLGEVSGGRVSVGARCLYHGIGVTLGWLELKRVGVSACYSVALH